MGLFGKKEKQESTVPELPRLPELPKFSNYEQSPNLDYDSPQIPIKEFPQVPNQTQPKEPIHQLPRFPTGEMGDKFSQNTIKNAITGQDEPEYVQDMENYEINHEPMELEPELEKRIIPQEPTREAPTIDKGPRTHSDEPVFIRIDKFEESLKIFDKIKGKLSEIEDLLKETKEIKEKEKEELTTWEEEIQKLKAQVEKVDEDIFSKIE